MNSSVKKFRSLITDISIIAKIESEMTSLELIDVEEVVTNILWSLEDKIKLSNATITQHLEVKQVLFSKNNLRSILFNLISNAIKFNDNLNPTVIIKTYKEEGILKLSVEDNGIGMNQIDLGKIFNMYGRLHQQIEGHGIGLYLAKKIVDAAEGNIIVESELGKGSKFMINFS
jgi:light-regulated signal transduction histidine kinase (bacteriophytochrome)